MQIPVLNGIYTDENSDIRVSYPRNLMPVPSESGLSKGYLRPTDGIVSAGTGPGVDRGGINWQDRHYRVMGSKFVSVDAAGVVTTIGDVGSGGFVSLDYSFDRLGISSNGNLFYYDGTTLTQVTDVDLGTVLDHIWVDGYFMTTDGENLVVTELSDPTQVDPFKYGSSESDPDPIVAILKLDNEPYALNRYTIEVFDNIGGSAFPFQRIEGAIIKRGAIGTHACCEFDNTIAFVGSGRNEALSVWRARSGDSVRIATREIDLLLTQYTEAQLAEILIESQVYSGHRLLYVHLPDKTLVYDAAASQVVGTPIWFVLSSGLLDEVQYRGRSLVFVHDRWWVGDTQSAAVGYTSNAVGEHWGATVGWQFGTLIVYNGGTGGIFHELELVGLPGRAALGADPTVWTQYSLDGETWSVPKSRSAGKQGERLKRLNWLGQGAMRNWRIQRFYGTSDARLSIARLEARLEPLAV